MNGALRRDYTPSRQVPDLPRDPWDARPTDLHRQWWEARIARQKEIDASIAAKADYEYLYDKPYEDRGRSFGSPVRSRWRAWRRTARLVSVRTTS